MSSGILAPAPPIIRAMIMPRPTPFCINAMPIGSILSARIYIGIPIMVATQIAKVSFICDKKSKNSFGTKL